MKICCSQASLVCLMLVEVWVVMLMHADVPAAPRTAPVLLQRQTGRHTIGCRAKQQNHVTM